MPGGLTILLLPTHATTLLASLARGVRSRLPFLSQQISQAGGETSHSLYSLSDSVPREWRMSRLTTIKRLFLLYMKHWGFFQA